MGDSKNYKKKGAFDFESELSTLVEKKALHPKIAEKLKTKLNQNNITLTKNQLYKLVDKLNEILNIRKPSIAAKTNLSSTTSNTPQKDENMAKLYDSIDSLEERLNELEENLGNISLKKDSTKFVKTDDIKVEGDIEVPDADINLEPLTEVPNNPESVIVLMKWLQYLIDKCGRENLSNILDYYVDIGWISEDAKISLIDYSHGITEENKESNTKNISDLPSKDHIQSLVFIQKLKGNKLNKHFIDKIDSELTRITKKLDNYNLK